MALSSLAFRFELASQPRPRTGADRSLNIFDAQHVNRLALRTTSPTAGVSLELNSVQITAPADLPTQLTQDLAFTVTIDGTTVSVTVPAASTAQNGQASDMVTSLNNALTATSFAGAGLNQKLRAILVGNRVRRVNIDSATQELSIQGAAILGFASNQSKDANTARTELGLSDPGTTAGSTRDGLLASPEFRAVTIQRPCTCPQWTCPTTVRRSTVHGLAQLLAEHLSAALNSTSPSVRPSPRRSAWTLIKDWMLVLLS